MHQYPPLPDADDAPDSLFTEGHLWLSEKVDGAHLRFELADTGVLRFGDENRVWRDGDVPEPYGHAVRHVRESVDREALRDAADGAGGLVVYGVATQRRAIDYDWDQIPNFLGFDVWAGERDAFCPPDIAEKVVEGIGLAAINTFDREVPAKHFHLDRYEIPDSDWYDGPAAGVVFRNKRGLRAKLDADWLDTADGPGPVDVNAEEFAERTVSEGTVRRIVRDLDSAGRATTPEAVVPRVTERVFRTEYASITHHESSVDPKEVKSALAARTQTLLNRIDD
ncbi:RNA ligase family protein [Haloarchaeobius sp. DFWS5]|uniref:RNA ligase family protein n=1 Tax=Haloarchaeobius sp. DFWS5 TaxID=3446114 RepID=UPI003EBDDF61